MFLKKLALAALLGASAMAAVPGEAEARDRHHRHSYHHRDYDRWDDRRDYRRSYYRDNRRDYRSRHRYRCRSSGTTGLIVGGAAGALLGREVDRYGDRTPGTIIGAAAGALLGREVDRGGRCCSPSSQAPGRGARRVPAAVSACPPPPRTLKRSDDGCHGKTCGTTLLERWS